MIKSIKMKIPILIFTFPALLMFLVVVCYPILQTVYRSMFEWDGIGTADFTGFKNYLKLVGDSNFLTASKNGLIFAAVLVIYQMGLGTVLALLLLDKKIPGRKFFKSSYFIPVVLSITIGCQLWLSIYNSEHGLLNKLLELMGFSYRQHWLSEDGIAIYAVAFVNAWQYLGIHFVLIYTAAKSIPEHYYEAALIDGASTPRMHWQITLPLLAESFKFCLVLAITGGLKAFENMYIMTNGGPGTATYTITYHMYSSAFRANQYGYACASATALVLQCLVFTVLINRFIARERIVY